jgi:molybdopterin-guanine dinucleotide biosynthesis protein A
MIKVGTLAILVGGDGYRMKQVLLDNIEKPFRPIGCFTMLEYILQNLQAFIEFERLILIAKDETHPTYKLIKELQSRQPGSTIGRATVICDKENKDFTIQNFNLSQAYYSLYETLCSTKSCQSIMMANCDTIYSGAFVNQLEGVIEYFDNSYRGIYKSCHFMTRHKCYNFNSHGAYSYFETEKKNSGLVYFEDQFALAGLSQPYFIPLREPFECYFTDLGIPANYLNFQQNH